ncbi:MAG: prepilin peptidase [Oceanobacter sp.]
MNRPSGSVTQPDEVSSRPAPERSWIYRRPRSGPVSALIRSQLIPQTTSPLDQWVHDSPAYWLMRPFSHRFWYQRLLPEIKSAGLWLSDLDEAELDQQLQALRSQLRQQGLTQALLCQTFAMIREVAGRTLGMYHFDAQLLGGLAILHGNIAEMQTGEGKTLTAVLPAAAAALAGIPAHVVTANDYLASRDTEEMKPVYRRLGLSVGCVTQAMTVDERRPIYAGDVMYCSNSELVFDYLKDNLVLTDSSDRFSRFADYLNGQQNLSQQLMLRGLHFAIIDEADSVLLDEARTPLIISGEVAPNPAEQRLYRQAIRIASGLQQDDHFRLQKSPRSISFTQEGERVIDQQCKPLGQYWVGKVRRLELIHKALTALHLFDCDIHYLIRDDKICIIDENSGRVMPDRTWEQGLHQLIEIKEGCPMTNPRNTLARMSNQKFFGLYHHVGGMTGTAAEVGRELWSIYRLSIVHIPPNAASKRRYLGRRCFADDSEKWIALADRVAELHQQGRAVLVGTARVADSETLNELLRERGLQCQLLTARHDSEEAEVVSAAGQPGQITVATAMAGRGTDIKLAPEVSKSGGLHVILTELQDSARIDRQLIGRCARQGDPGSFEYFLSVDNLWALSWWQRHKATFLRRWLTISPTGRLASWSLWRTIRSQQKRIQKQHARMRQQLLKQDQHEERRLAFTNDRYS